MAQLVPLVKLLCAELALQYECQGRHTPPWRTFPALSARWLSRSYSEAQVPDLDTGTAAAAGGACPALTVQARLNAFLERCEAVQHASSHLSPDGATRRKAQRQQAAGADADAASVEGVAAATAGAALPLLPLQAQGAAAIRGRRRPPGGAVFQPAQIVRGFDLK